MTNRCPSCSQFGGERGNPQAEARCGEPVSRNASELDSASLRYVGVTKLPKVLKSAIVGEATLESSRRTPRGGWRRRAGKEKSRNLRGPAWAVTPRRESDGLIVARKGLIRLERRGPTVSVRALKLTSSVWPKGRLRESYETAEMRADGAWVPECLQERRMRENCMSGSTRGSDGKGIALR